MWTARIVSGRGCRDHAFETKRKAHAFAQAKRREVQPTGSRRPGNIQRVGLSRKIYAVYSTGGK